MLIEKQITVDNTRPIQPLISSTTIHANTPAKTEKVNNVASKKRNIL
jgi:hypothetical protein